MKKSLIALAALFCMACEEGVDVRRTIDSTLLIPKSGLQTFTYPADAATAAYEVGIYRSGYNEGGSKASLYVDEAALEEYNKAKQTDYRLMPANSYTLPAAVVSLTNESFMKTVRIDFSTDGLADGNYVLPLSLKSEDGTPLSEDSRTVLILVQPEPEEAPE